MTPKDAPATNEHADQNGALDPSGSGGGGGGGGGGSSGCVTAPALPTITWKRNEFIRLAMCLISSRLAAVMGTLMNGSIGGGVDEARNNSNRWLMDDKNDDSNPRLTALIAEVFNDPEFKPGNAASHIPMCTAFDPDLIYAERTADQLKTKIREIKKMNTVPFKALFSLPSGTHQKPEVTDVVARLCTQQEAPLVAYFATVFDGELILDFMHKNLAAGEGFEEGDEDDDSGGEMGEEDEYTAQPSGTRVSLISVSLGSTPNDIPGSAAGAAGVSKTDLLDVMREADKTADLVAAVKELVAPTASIAVGIDPELQEWMALRPNLPQDQQIIIDGLAADAIKKLQERLRPPASSEESTPVMAELSQQQSNGAAATTAARAFAGEWS